RRRDISVEETLHRLIGALLNEAAYALDEGLIESPSDGDIGAIYGFGYPPFRGGPFWAMDRMGLPAVVERLRALEAKHGRRFAPAPGLISMADSNRKYISDK
ncbi:MAG: 3-hydroxyacyl-CoA dehydrogenase family protein, partial [Candidatus Neomarinimicrobiota bacterium]